MLIFVDVDGVLNAMGKSEGFTTYQVPVNGTTYPVHLNPEHGKWLDNLIFDTPEIPATLVWCTYWEENAQKHIAPVLGLPFMPFVSLPTLNRYTNVASSKAWAAACYADGEDFVYFDDEFNIGRELTDWKVPGKHIWVEPYSGLQESHIEEAREYISSRIPRPTCVVCNSQNGVHEDYCVTITVR